MKEVNYAEVAINTFSVLANTPQFSHPCLQEGAG